MDKLNNVYERERDALLEALRIADVECLFCAHRECVAEDCVDYCCDCEHKCLCYLCDNRSNWEWKGFEEGC